MKLFASRAQTAPILLLMLGLCLSGCAGPGRVQYDGGRCLKDGRVLVADDVEAEEATVASRIASRQPWFAVITIAVVLVAAAGNMDRALMLLRARHVQGHRPLSERLRDVLERHRESPVRFAAIVGASFGFIAVAAGTYIYLDIDKRASERALGMLQFCHLALRTQDEGRVLSEQRHNLEAIEATAGDIRSLVGRLPPEEQRKAQQIVTQMNAALAQQGKLVGAYVARTGEAQKDLNARTLSMEKGIASVEGDLSELRSIPRSLKDLESATRHVDEATAVLDGRVTEVHARITAVEEKLNALLARPACATAATANAPEVAMVSPAPSGSSPRSFVDAAPTLNAAARPMPSASASVIPLPSPQPSAANPPSPTDHKK